VRDVYRGACLLGPTAQNEPYFRKPGGTVWKQGTNLNLLVSEGCPSAQPKKKLEKKRRGGKFLQHAQLSRGGHRQLPRRASTRDVGVRKGATRGHTGTKFWVRGRGKRYKMKSTLIVALTT